MIPLSSQYQYKYQKETKKEKKKKKLTAFVMSVTPHRHYFQWIRSWNDSYQQDDRQCYEDENQQRRDTGQEQVVEECGRMFFVC